MFQRDRIALALVLALGAASVAPLARAGDQDALAAWLAQHADGPLDRADPATLELRKQGSGLPAQLVALARDRARPIEVRRRAIELAAVVDDDADAADALGALGQDAPVAGAAREAQARAAVRAALLGKLAEVAPSLGGRAPRAGELRAVLDSAAAARELAALARDPLLDAPRRRTAVLALPLAAPLAKLDLAAIAAGIASGRAPGQGAVRAAALELLGEHASPLELARALGQACSDADPDVERAVLAAMPLVRDDGALRAFAALGLAESAPVEARARALEALGRTRSDLARTWVERHLRDAVPVAEDDERAAALSALARLGARPPAEMADALADLLSSPRLSARGRALDALGELPRAVVADALGTRLVDPAPDDVRLRTADAAGALGLPLAGPLEQLARSQSSSLAARTAAVRALAAVGEPATSVDALAQVLATARESDEDASLRRAAAEALGARALRGELARHVLEGALADASPSVRVAAARALGAQGDARAASGLVAAIGRADLGSREREEIVRALVALRAWDEATAARVASALDEDPSAELAIAATEYFAEAPRKLAIPALIELLEHPDLAARQRAHGTLLALAGDKVGVERAHDPFDYDPAPAANAERSEAVKRWRGWWERHKKDYAGP